MKKSMMILIVLALASGLALAETTKPADVNGHWDLTVTTPRGERTSTLAIVQDGEKLKVTMTSPRGETTGEGTIKGSDIEWTVTRTTPQGEMTSVYQGKVQGDSMSGDVKFGTMGSGTWKAVRQKA
jgi:hypothetical protein